MDHAQTRKLLAALVRHPNAAGVLVLHLGCENIQPDQFKEELGPYDPDGSSSWSARDVEDEFAAARKLLEELADYARQFERQPIPVSELVVGMKCGGSDGLSGITANPTIGRFSDMLGQRGGSTVLTEVPEMFGAEGFLMNRCIDRKVFEKAEHMLNGFKHYFISHNEVVYDNPSPGNKQGGITTLEDKSCGCVQKGGTAPIMDVIDYGDPVVTKGLNMLYGPGNDLVSATAMTAAGAHMILFSNRTGDPLLGAGPHVEDLHQHPPGGKEARLDRLQRRCHRRRQKDHRPDRPGPAAAGDRHRQRQTDQGRDQWLPGYLHLQGRRGAVKAEKREGPCQKAWPFLKNLVQ